MEERKNEEAMKSASIKSRENDEEKEARMQWEEWNLRGSHPLKEQCWSVFL